VAHEFVKEVLGGCGAHQHGIGPREIIIKKKVVAVIEDRDHSLVVGFGAPNRRFAYLVRGSTVFSTKLFWLMHVCPAEGQPSYLVSTAREVVEGQEEKYEIGGECIIFPNANDVDDFEILERRRCVGFGKRLLVANAPLGNDGGHAVANFFHKSVVHQGLGALSV